MSDNNEKEVGYEELNTRQLGSIGVADVFSDIGRSLDDMAEQLKARLGEINDLKTRVSRLEISCLFLAIATIIQAIMLWKN